MANVRRISVAPMPGCEKGMVDSNEVLAPFQGRRDEYSPLFAFRKFATEVSIAGFKYVTDHEAFPLRRLLWCCFVLFGFGFAFYQISMQTRYYLTYQTNVDIKITNNESLLFPTITICNENIYNRSAVEKFDPRVAQALEIMFPPLLDPSNPINFTEAFSLVQDHVTRDWNDIWDEFNLDVESLMPRCIFNSKECDPSMYTTIKSEIGRCLQFNHGGNLTIGHAGGSAGLQLTLIVDELNYISQISPSAGYRLYLHDVREPPMMYERAFKVNVNQHSLVQMSTIKTIQKPSPYGSCSDQEGYVTNACIQNCLIDYLYDKCSCVNPNMRNGGTGRNQTICNPVDLFSCLVPNFIAFYSGPVQQCGCPQQCTQTMYPYAITASDTSPNFLRWYSAKNKVTTEYIKNNLVLLDIYYSTLEYEVLEMKPSYSLLSLFCDIGGALGLILGSTVLTLFEITDFACVLIWDGITARKMKIDKH